MILLGLLGLLFLGANASQIWICPSQDSFPTSKDVHFSQPSDPSCLSFFVPPSFSAFFVKHQAELLLPKIGLIRAFPLEFFPSFSVVISADEYIEEFDALLLGTEKQQIPLSLPLFARSSPFSPFSPFSAVFRNDSVKDDLVNSLNKDDYLLEMRRITGDLPLTVGGKQYTIKTRYSFVESNLIAGNYFLERLKNLGYEAFFQEFTATGQQARNIIGIKKGSKLSNEIVVVGAHMDSISQDSRNNAPGCIDNGSGSEAVMLLAKAFANVTTDRTIHFILFGAEEQGLIGSNYYVNNLQRNGYNVVTSLVMDMIGYSSRYHGVKLETSRSQENTQLSDLMVANIKAYSPKLTIERATNYFGSDHVPFIDSGIPCFLAIEQDDVSYPGYHRTTDTVSYLSVNQSIDISRALAGTLYDCAF